MKKPNFHKYIKIAEITNDLRGDFLIDAKVDPNLKPQNCRSLGGLLRYLEKRGASDGCLRAAEATWNSYERWLHENLTLVKVEIR